MDNPTSSNYQSWIPDNMVPSLGNSTVTLTFTWLYETNKVRVPHLSSWWDVSWCWARITHICRRRRRIFYIQQAVLPRFRLEIFLFIGGNFSVSDVSCHEPLCSYISSGNSAFSGKKTTTKYFDGQYTSALMFSSGGLCPLRITSLLETFYRRRISTSGF